MVGTYFSREWMGTGRKVFWCFQALQVRLVYLHRRTHIDKRRVARIMLRDTELRCGQELKPAGNCMSKRCDADNVGCVVGDDDGGMRLIGCGAFLVSWAEKVF